MGNFRSKAVLKKCVCSEFDIIRTRNCFENIDHICVCQKRYLFTERNGKNNEFVNECKSQTHKCACQYSDAIKYCKSQNHHCSCKVDRNMCRMQNESHECSCDFNPQKCLSLKDHICTCKNNTDNCLSTKHYCFCDINKPETTVSKCKSDDHKCVCKTNHIICKALRGYINHHDFHYCVCHFANPQECKAMYKHSCSCRVSARNCKARVGEHI